MISITLGDDGEGGDGSAVDRQPEDNGRMGIRLWLNIIDEAIIGKAQGLIAD